ncbi:MAG: MBOAT family protein [Deltaproteobacteria bacterium]|nr:MBOAT family protein [Deltaproteobacteria bacterium]
MVFSSLLFLFIFLPVVLAGNLLLPLRWRNLFLLAASLVFYAWGETLYVVVMLVSIGLNYAFGLLISRSQSLHARRWTIALAVTANLSLLGFFKYANFMVDSLALLFQSISLSPPHLAAIHLPIGISFFTFQGISYLVDVYRNDVPAQESLLDLGLYISLFPQLIAGPIIRYHDVARELRDRRITAADFSYGIGRFIQGLGKKVLIANVMAGVVDRIFALPLERLTVPLAWLGVIGYALQIYYDFSGYSDMAIGLGRMFGFHYLENFDHPYIAGSVREFWRRWHISLSNWFRDYLYIPLGGNKKGRIRTYANLFTVFLLCGLWHGADWHFVIWGALHGVFMVFERIGLGRILKRLWAPLRHLYLLLFLSFSWVIFRADSMAAAIHYLTALIGRNSPGLSLPLAYLLNPEVFLAGLAGILFAVPWPLKGLAALWRGEKGNLPGPEGMWRLAMIAGHGTIFLIALLDLSVNAYNPFIYFRF